MAALLAVLSVVMLERQRGGVTSERLVLASSPVTIWRPDDAGGGPLVVVAHGYAGSRRMMQPISIALARSGFTVAAFDFFGHGRNPIPMQGDPTSIDGTTAQLVDQTLAVARAAGDLPGVSDPVSLVGHSMATDIVIRAADRLDRTAAVVAISMYSDAVTPDAPERLLIVSGAHEGRLREVALDRLRQIDPDGAEGVTVTRGAVERRAVSAPRVGHVGVLYSPVTLREVRDWIGGARDGTPSAPLPRIGPWLLALLSSLVLLMWPVARMTGPVVPHPERLGRKAVAMLALPVAPALLATIAVPPAAGSFVAFAAFAAFFGIWGAVQLALLRRGGMRPGRLHPTAIAILLVWGLGIFALALDRYGAAFVPTGPRLGLMGLLMLGTIPFCVADAVVTARSGWVAAGLQRLLPLVTLLGAMLITPPLGIAFTVLPVMVLFWLVYGIAARWVRLRSDPWSAGLALGVILAWAIAASTPLLAS
ncbi:alpha/beta fold hydrolase [Palleronia sp. LCG004]|uniref:alpha/beta fold hydrolase n=1 Tax=Palleronia sp. LCG004 TaxID=3079304 RepID=UPI00294293A3|nr:alpha/beta fold hydrolase [Palleronia sp. LCG004]WOI57802.1 alpha/beta fold hydrolase [Palleronia sp. LCG004]